MVKVCFLLLHFKATDITSRCIESILSLTGGEEAQIVVVDNASNDGSGEILTQKYKSNRNVHVIILTESSGFSFGNNKGYQFCMQQFDPDYVVIANNDIIFSQKDFITNMVESYRKEPYAIGGPDIIDLNSHLHCSPTRKNLKDIAEVKDFIESLKYGQKHVKSILFKEWMEQKKRSIFRTANNILKVRPKQFDYAQIYEDVLLWGACLIFTKDYMKIRELPFEPETNFYHEEDILFFQADKLGLKVKYDPCMKVEHGGSVATKAKYKNRIARKQFQLENNLKGSMIYLNLMENWQDE